MLPKKYLSGSAKRKLNEQKEEEIKKLHGNLNKYAINTETFTSLITGISESK